MDEKKTKQLEMKQRNLHEATMAPNLPNKIKL